MLLGIAFTVYLTVTLLLSSTGSNLKSHPRNDMVNQAKDSPSSHSKDNDSIIIHAAAAAAVNHYDLHYLLDTLRRELKTPSLYPEYYYDSKHPSRFTTAPSISLSSSLSASSIEVVPLPVSSCRITYTIDPYAIAFYQDILHDYKHQQLMSQRYRFDSDFREYLNEWLLLEFFLSSPCRINGTDDDDNNVGRGSQGGNDINYRYDQQTRVSESVRQPSMPLNNNVNNSNNNNNSISTNDLSTRSNPPNYHIIFLPFKYLLSIKQALSIATKRIITKVFMNAITSPSFEHHRQSYILVHASTLNFKELFVNILTHYDKVIMIR
jgi:hypothetical protein